MYLSTNRFRKTKINKWIKKLEKEIEVIGESNKLGISAKELEAAIKSQYKEYYSNSYNEYLNSFLSAVFNYIGIVDMLIEIEASTSDPELAEIIKGCDVKEKVD